MFSKSKWFLLKIEEIDVMNFIITLNSMIVNTLLSIINSLKTHTLTDKQETNHFMTYLHSNLFT